MSTVVTVEVRQAGAVVASATCDRSWAGTEWLLAAFRDIVQEMGAELTIYQVADGVTWPKGLTQLEKGDAAAT